MIARFLSIAFFGSQVLSAYPPAPPTTTFGKVRGTFGYGISDGLTDLLLLADDREVSRTTISETGAFSENYRLTLPIDLNPAKGVYRLAAVTPKTSVIYSFAAEKNGKRIPISEVETVGSNDPLTAGKVRKINFVLGADTDGDGLPDDWERFQAGLLGGFEGNPLDLFSATGDYDGDGLSDVGEYIAGTFALIFEDGLNFEVTKVYESGRADLRFLAIGGKTYRIESTSDFKTWTPVVFSLPNDPVSTTSIFKSDDTNFQMVMAEPGPTGPKIFYRLQVD